MNSIEHLNNPHEGNENEPKRKDIAQLVQSLKTNAEQIDFNQEDHTNEKVLRDEKTESEKAEDKEVLEKENTAAEDLDGLKAKQSALWEQAKEKEAYLLSLKGKDGYEAKYEEFKVFREGLLKLGREISLMEKRIKEQDSQNLENKEVEKQEAPEKNTKNEQEIFSELQAYAKKMFQRMKSMKGKPGFELAHEQWMEEVRKVEDYEKSLKTGAESKQTFQKEESQQLDINTSGNEQKNMNIEEFEQAILKKNEEHEERISEKIKQQENQVLNNQETSEKTSSEKEIDNSTEDTKEDVYQNEHGEKIDRAYGLQTIEGTKESVDNSEKQKTSFKERFSKYKNYWTEKVKDSKFAKVYKGYSAWANKGTKAEQIAKRALVGGAIATVVGTFSGAGIAAVTGAAAFSGARSAASFLIGGAATGLYEKRTQKSLDKKNSDKKNLTADYYNSYEESKKASEVFYENEEGSMESVNFRDRQEIKNLRTAREKGGINKRETAILERIESERKIKAEELLKMRAQYHVRKNAIDKRINKQEKNRTRNRIIVSVGAGLLGGMSFQLGDLAFGTSGIETNFDPKKVIPDSAEQVSSPDVIEEGATEGEVEKVDSPSPEENYPTKELDEKIAGETSETETDSVIKDEVIIDTPKPVAPESEPLPVPEQNPVNPTKLENIFVHKGEGVTYPFLEKIKVDENLQKYFKLGDNFTDAEAIEAAKEAAVKTGYLSETGELRVKYDEGAGYDLSVGEDGKLQVQEYEDIIYDPKEGTYEGGVKGEIHKEGTTSAEFEGDRDYEKHREYVTDRGAVETQYNSEHRFTVDDAPVYEHPGAKLAPADQLQGLEYTSSYGETNTDHLDNFKGSRLDDSVLQKHTVPYEATENMQSYIPSTNVLGERVREYGLGSTMSTGLNMHESLGGANVPQKLINLFENGKTFDSHIDFKTPEDTKLVFEAMGIEIDPDAQDRTSFRSRVTEEKLNFKDIYEKVDINKVKQEVERLRTFKRSA